eukprot:scaffold93264_cov60-Phaeocystis_antarctica.AAC.2
MARRARLVQIGASAVLRCQFDAPGTQGTRGPNARTLSRLAECQAPIAAYPGIGSIFLAMPERQKSGPVATPDGPLLVPIGASAVVRYAWDTGYA